MAGELEKAELMRWYFYRADNTKLVPLPGVEMAVNLKFVPAAKAALEKAQYVVLIHPRLPQVGVVTKVVGFEDIETYTKVELKLLRRVKIVSGRQDETGYLVRLEKFGTVYPNEADFKNDAHIKSRVRLVRSATLIAEKLGYKRQSVEEVLGPSPTPKKFENVIDLFAEAIQDDIPGCHPVLVDGLVSVLGESDLMIRAERLRKLQAWIYEKLFHKEDFSYENKIEQPAIFFGSQAAAPDVGLSDAKFPEEVKKVIQEESARLENACNVNSSETDVIRRYVHTLKTFPWAISTEEKTDISEARKILEEDTFGLSKVKDRILEFLAVRHLNPNAKGGILCIGGPPGAGKTALAKSVARALGRKMDRISLGGLKDAAELKGHRRTYIGAIPGKFVHILRKLGCNNPVIVLDELDKIGQEGARRDAENVLLEALDPEQNYAFYDHYMEVPIDLSKVMFISTANYIPGISAPLRDRLQIVEVHGYAESEKVTIAQKHLLPKLLTDCGLRSSEGLPSVRFQDETLRKIIREHTSEAGVRALGRCMETVLGKIALMDCEYNVRLREQKLVTVIHPEDVHSYLGYPPASDDFRDLTSLRAGSVPFLLVMSSGEGSVGTLGVSSRPSEKFNRTISGILTLQSSIEESVKVALTMLMHGNILSDESRAKMLKSHFHIHFNEGGTGKDGPSGGVMILLAIISNVLGLSIRKGLTGTGEVTLGGEVLPIGGTIGKILAAVRRGFKEMFVPVANANDLDELPQELKNNIEVIFPEKDPEKFRALAKDAGPKPKIMIYCLGNVSEALSLAFPGRY